MVALALCGWSLTAQAAAVPASEQLSRFQELIAYRSSSGADVDTVRELANRAQEAYASLDPSDPDRAAFHARVVEPLTRLRDVADTLEDCELGSYNAQLIPSLLGTVQPCSGNNTDRLGPLAQTTTAAARTAFVDAFRRSARRQIIENYVMLSRWFGEGGTTPLDIIEEIYGDDSPVKAGDVLAEDPQLRRRLEAMPSISETLRRMGPEAMANTVNHTLDEIAWIRSEMGEEDGAAELEARRASLRSLPFFWGVLSENVTYGAPVTPRALVDATEAYFRQARGLLMEIETRLDDPDAGLAVLLRRTPELVVATLLDQPAFAGTVCDLVQETIEQAESDCWWDRFWDYSLDAVFIASATVAFIATAPVTITVATVVGVAAAGTKAVRYYNQSQQIESEAQLAENAWFGGGMGHPDEVASLYTEADAALEQAVWEGILSATVATRFLRVVRILGSSGRTAQATRLVRNLKRLRNISIAGGATYGLFQLGDLRHEVGGYLEGEEHIGYGIHLDMDRIRAALSDSERELLDHPEGREAELGQMLMDKIYGDYDVHETLEFTPLMKILGTSIVGAPERQAVTFFETRQGDYVYRGVCRHKALVLWSILRRVGVNAELRIGDLEGKRPHMWVELPEAGLALEATTNRAIPIVAYRKDFENVSTVDHVTGGMY